MRPIQVPHLEGMADLLASLHHPPKVTLSATPHAKRKCWCGAPKHKIRNRKGA